MVVPVPLTTLTNEPTNDPPRLKCALASDLCAVVVLPALAAMFFSFFSVSRRLPTREPLAQPLDGTHRLGPAQLGRLGRHGRGALALRGDGQAVPALRQARHHHAAGRRRLLVRGRRGLSVRSRRGTASPSPLPGPAVSVARGSCSFTTPTRAAPSLHLHWGRSPLRRRARDDLCPARRLTTHPTRLRRRDAPDDATTRRRRRDARTTS